MISQEKESWAREQVTRANVYLNARTAERDDVYRMLEANVFLSYMCFSVSVVLSDARRRPGYPDALKKLADTNSVAHAVMTRSRTSSRSSTATQRKLESLVENHSALDAVPNGKSIPLSFISPPPVFHHARSGW
ncbi:hypothetical protein PILCRDRAFT_825829 [Piloderma croceum F 1598]|uniref:Uncharacterized protein n=1 Tax=Piloderma croceum (strain F 1598) TaxID=765440 RepID=A0A0C3BHK7_PILCF|nr:hypothetical protein PILCRDRAFT_825829 [Piloderma croceum F 1598]